MGDVPYLCKQKTEYQPQKQKIMNNEETLYDKNVQDKSAKAWKGTVGAAAGGAVLGAGVTAAGQAFASQTAESGEGLAAEGNEGAASENVTAEGVKVAITTDSQSFGEAFAAARAQVGPGGVFEWHGKLYNTYTKEEWNAMTPEQKHDFAEAVQPQIEAMPEQHHHATAHHQHNVSHHHDNTNAGNTMEEEIHVIDVRHNVDFNGEQVDVAVIEVDGHGGIIIDVDQNGMGDFKIIDENDNNKIDENEVTDISNEGYQMPQQTPGDAYMAQADDMPDYVNDATV